MSRGLAPTAMRTPISRVRSVTLTSMMFMIPMPPTSSDTAAMLASSVVSVLVPSCCALGDLGQVADREVVVGRRAAMWWRSRRSVGDCVSARGGVLGRGRADEDGAREVLLQPALNLGLEGA